MAIDDVECVSRRVLREIFKYPFKQLGVNRLQAVTSVTNMRCREFIERLGFQAWRALGVGPMTASRTRRYTRCFRLSAAGFKESPWMSMSLCSRNGAVFLLDWLMARRINGTTETT